MTYRSDFRKFLFSFTQARLAPFLGISLTFALVAHKSLEGLASFAYIMAIFAMISAPLSLPLNTVGNIVAREAARGSDLRVVFRQGLGFALSLAMLSCILAGAVVLGRHAIQQGG